MKILLDTHVLIWSIMNMRELSVAAHKLIEDYNNILYYSTVSVWEVAIKHRLRPNSIPCSGREFVDLCEASDIYSLPLTNKHVVAFENLTRQDNAPAHKDPFDQVLISQAIAERMVFLTHDKTLQYYDGVEIRIV